MLIELREDLQKIFFSKMNTGESQSAGIKPALLFRVLVLLTSMVFFACLHSQRELLALSILQTIFWHNWKLSHCLFQNSKQSQQWKQQNNVWGLFKVNNENTKTTAVVLVLLFWTLSRSKTMLWCFHYLSHCFQISSTSFRLKPGSSLVSHMTTSKTLLWCEIC